MADFHSETMSVITVDAAPGEGPDLHRHPYEEVFAVLEGEASSDATPTPTAVETPVALTG